MTLTVCVRVCLSLLSSKHALNLCAYSIDVLDFLSVCECECVCVGMCVCMTVPNGTQIVEATQLCVCVYLFVCVCVSAITSATQCVGGGHSLQMA